MYYEEYGTGEPVVFLHGFTLDHRMWTPQIEFFRPYYRLLIPDARGHGRSDAPATGYGRRDRVEDLKRFADKLKIDRFHAVGLSMGGSTSLGLALDSPERLKSMTLVSSGAAGYD
ncbi:MAG: alpha/beta fold hydrolase, partial [Candidatus Zixiibacteriota bacterium]